MTGYQLKGEIHYMRKSSPVGLLFELARKVGRLSKANFELQHVSVYYTGDDWVAIILVQEV